MCSIQHFFTLAIIIASFPFTPASIFFVIFMWFKVDGPTIFAFGLHSSMAHLETRAEWWLRPDSQKLPRWKKLSDFKPPLQPWHDKVEIQRAQSQTTATTSGPDAAANANDAESDAADAKNAQLWLEAAADAKAHAKTTASKQKLQRPSCEDGP